MYGPKWPFLLIYGSHDMRHTGIPQVDGLSTDPWVLGRHNLSCRIQRRKHGFGVSWLVERFVVGG